MATDSLNPEGEPGPRTRPGASGPTTPPEQRGGVPQFDAPPPEFTNRSHPGAPGSQATIAGLGAVEAGGHVQAGTGNTNPDDPGRTSPKAAPAVGRSHDAGGVNPDEGPDAAGAPSSGGPSSASGGGQFGSAGAAARVTNDPNFANDAAKLGAAKEQESHPARQGP